jgi:hypothetical protein
MHQRGGIMSTPATGLELRLTGRQTTYKLDLGSHTPAEFREHIEQLRQQSRSRGGVTFPDPPAVDLQLEIVNRGSEEIVIWLGGDDSWLTLELGGPGALSISFGVIRPAMYIPSSPVRLPADGRHVLPLERLVHGSGGSYWYWTETGRYTLTARWQLGAEVQGTTGPVLESNPILLEVQ